MKSKHGDILVLPESSINVDGCWNAEKMVNQTESHQLFTTPYRSVHFRHSFRHACKAKEAVVGTKVNLLPRAIHLQCTAQNTDGV